jgi:hypothetical protein
MTQQSSFRQFGGSAVYGPWDTLVRFAATELALVLAIVVICLLAGGASLRTTSLPAAMGSIRAEPSAVGADKPDRDGTSRANDDGYVEGLEKALGL